MEGTDQVIPVYTNTATAICDVTQKSKLVGSTQGREGTLFLGKSREPLTVSCYAPGYDSKTVHVVSGATGWGVTSFFFWDFAITDWITGGLNKYPDGISVALSPVPGQERLRQDTLSELNTQPRIVSGSNSMVAQIRPARLIPYADGSPASLDEAPAMIAAKEQ